MKALVKKIIVSLFGEEAAVEIGASARRMLNALRDPVKALRYRRIRSSGSLEDRFTQIYQQGIWFANKESHSGRGSTLEATTSLRRDLPALVKELGVQRIVDAGCGDFNWMKEIVPQFDCEYVGGDVVRDLIEENQRKYGSDRVRFQHLDIVNGVVPESDLVMCREVLFHLSFSDIRKALQNFIDSGARFVLVTTNPTVIKNKDISSGDVRELNFELAPFGLPSQEITLEDSAVGPGRVMALWSTEALATSLSDYASEQAR